MRWRHDHYLTTCRRCTLTGNLRISTDGEGGFRSAWVNVSDARIKRDAPEDSTGVCVACGSADIAIGPRGGAD